MPRDEVPKFFIPLENEVELECTRDNARLFTHADQYEMVDHIFIELEPMTEYLGDVAVKGYFAFRQALPNFDDVACYMIENDFWCLHKHTPDARDEEIYEHFASNDVDRGVPEEWNGAA